MTPPLGLFPTGALWDLHLSSFSGWLHLGHACHYQHSYFGNIDTSVNLTVWVEKISKYINKNLFNRDCSKKNKKMLLKKLCKN
jgi:hypothetical protein